MTMISTGQVGGRAYGGSGDDRIQVGGDIGTLDAWGGSGNDEIIGGANVI